MTQVSLCRVWRFIAAGIVFSTAMALPVLALEKEGMPDLSQQEQTCLPTSTTNLIIWFGLHGYPKLIVPGDSADDGYIHTVHRVMAATAANYDWGTRNDAIAYGIHKYVEDAGYDCDVEYRGIDWSQMKGPDIVKDDDEDKYKAYNKTPIPFSVDWLQQNDNPNKGFILLLAFIKYNRATNVFEDPLHVGHAVTLVNFEPGMVLIHDTAHETGQNGRKIMEPTVLTGGVFKLPGYDAPVSGLLLLNGLFSDDVLERLPGVDPEVLLTGAVCITMHPEKSMLLASTVTSPGGNGVVGAGAGQNSSNPSSTPGSGSAHPMSTTTTWVMWLLDLFLKK